VPVPRTEIIDIEYYIKFNLRRNKNLNIKDDTKKLSKEDIRMCIWIGFQRCEIVLKFHEIYLNMEDEYNYLNEYSTFEKANLKSKKHSFNYQKIKKIKLLSKDNNINTVCVPDRSLKTLNHT
jgi:hypothetical protein